MDAFTEVKYNVRQKKQHDIQILIDKSITKLCVKNILARARERQRLLQGAPDAKVSSLRESNKNAISEPDLTEVKNIPPRESASESSIPYRLSQTKDGSLEGNFHICSKYI